MSPSSISSVDVYTTTFCDRVNRMCSVEAKRSVSGNVSSDKHIRFATIFHIVFSGLNNLSPTISTKKRTKLVTAGSDHSKGARVTTSAPTLRLRNDRTGTTLHVSPVSVKGLLNVSRLILTNGKHIGNHHQVHRSFFGSS